MSSVAVLTQESFNEHRNGLLPEQAGGKCEYKFVLDCQKQHNFTFYKRPYFYLNLTFVYVQLPGQDPVLVKRKMPFLPTRKPFPLSLRRL